MVLVDTSVWIRFLSDRAPYAAELDRILALEEVSAHELVYGELLIGDRGGRREFLASYEKMHQASTVPHSDIVEFVRHRALHGRGVGWIDIQLLASALVDRLQLWTVDPRFSILAKELGVAYEPLGATGTL
jgi:predicted nucleic acid-binding protein